MSSGKGWIETAEQIINAKEAQIRRQADTITRLLAGMSLPQTNATPESGTVVLFKLADYNYLLEIESCEVDTDGSILITLKPGDDD